MTNDVLTVVRMNTKHPVLFSTTWLVRAMPADGLLHTAKAWWAESVDQPVLLMTPKAVKASRGKGKRKDTGYYLEYCDDLKSGWEAWVSRGNWRYE